jgi:hypothetical protein
MPHDKQRPLGICKVLLVNLKTLSVTQPTARSLQLFIELQKMMDWAECGRGLSWPNSSFWVD